VERGILVDNIVWTDVGQIILIVLGIVACVYLIILINNLNKSIAKIKTILDENEVNINQALKDIPVVTKNLIEISETAKKEVKSVEYAISSVSETVSTTAAAAGAFKNNVLDKIKTVVRFIEIARFIIPKGKKKLKLK